MKTKTQILTIVHNHDRESHSPLFCPFTGKVLIPESPEGEILDSDLPNTVIAIWHPEFVGWDEPDVVSNEFNFDLTKFSKIEDIKECSKHIDDMAGSEHYILIDHSSYGSFPGDFGRIVFLLKIPNTYKYF